MTEPSKFCVMTVGRSGSTALMEALDSDNVLLPDLLFDCPDSELLHPKRKHVHARWFSDGLKRDISTSDDLVDAFYSWPTEAKFIGFKSMPNRHKNFASFAGRTDVQFISLVREDVSATVASFRVAMLGRDQWSRKGGTQNKTWTFTEKEVPPVFGNLMYVLMSRYLIEGIPGAIELSYEQNCAPDFRDEALDEYFGRRIQLENPRHRFVHPVTSSTGIYFQDSLRKQVNRSRP